MQFNISKLGEWLGDKLTRNVDELTEEQLSTMSRAELVGIIAELQHKLAASREETGKVREEVMRIFVAM